MALSGCGGLQFNSAGSASPALSQISCGTLSLTGAQTKSCSVSLSSAALSATVVTLKSSSTALQIPTTLTIPVGSASANFNAVSSTVNTATSVTIIGSIGSVTKSAVITLYPVAVALSDVSCAASTLTGPATEACSVSLSGTATSPIVVTLKSSNSAVQVPSAVTVATGATTAGFSATVAAVSSTQSVTLTASAGGVSKSEVVQVQGSGAQSSTQHQVQLNWDAPVDSTDPIVGYRVYRMKAGGATYASLSSSLASQTSYTDATVQSGFSYDYVVTSVDGNGVESAYSNPTTITIP